MFVYDLIYHDINMELQVNEGKYLNYSLHENLCVYQGRLFSYSDTHRHRLGSNYLQIPVNCPYNARLRNYQRDGPQCVTDNQGISCYIIIITEMLMYSFRVIFKDIKMLLLYNVLMYDISPGKVNLHKNSIYNVLCMKNVYEKQIACYIIGQYIC